MPGYIRGSARQRGRDALTSAPLFSATNAALLKLDEDYQNKGMSLTSGGETNGASAASFGPFLDGEAPLLPEFMEANESTAFTEESANDVVQPFTEVRIVILLLAGFIVGLVYYASRGDYYYLKLEIGGSDLN